MSVTDIGAGRVFDHQLLGKLPRDATASMRVDGRVVSGIAGEPVVMTLLAHGIFVARTMPETNAPRGYFCGVGRCSDCAMTVDGELNVRTCVTPLRDGMVIETQQGLGSWEVEK